MLWTDCACSSSPVGDYGTVDVGALVHLCVAMWETSCNPVLGGVVLMATVWMSDAEAEAADAGADADLVEALLGATVVKMVCGIV